MDCSSPVAGLQSEMPAEYAAGDPIPIETDFDALASLEVTVRTAVSV
jgi:hypothetical protein